MQTQDLFDRLEEYQPFTFGLQVMRVVADGLRHATQQNLA
jgi:hypothetical protein